MYFEVFDLLLKKYKNIENLWTLRRADIEKDGIFTSGLMDDFFNCSYRENLDNIAKYMVINNIKMVTCYDTEYPCKLRLIKNRPIVLFYKGDISHINDESVAIVGSRNCTAYGRKCGNFFSYELASRNVNVISGLAIGIDAIAHCAALNANGKTYAVIGSGLDNIYPMQNIQLAKRIIEKGGAIITEYVIGTKPDKSNFPRRNRIISGIADAIIVVEASEKSGSLITANYAINQGKEVWAVPGNIFSNESKGTNKLINDGANVLTSMDDILRN
ncbi:MAG: DNA-processing protein DprA [Clostridia bacterium]|nr:DNA-processing protein DprA [Clostridia bacterium]